VLEQTAGGVHAAFVVAAALSLIAIACAFFVRSPAVSAGAVRE
jgi:DHA2 family lincomycin resistance protein-like MFS transporter